MTAFQSVLLLAAVVSFIINRAAVRYYDQTFRTFIQRKDEQERVQNLIAWTGLLLFFAVILLVLTHLVPVVADNVNHWREMCEPYRDRPVAEMPSKCLNYYRGWGR